MQVKFKRMQYASQRGQALLETAVILPVFLLLLYGLLWIVTSGVVNERVQVAVRYSGMVSNENSPYVNYSLYALYNNLSGMTPPAKAPCVAPNTDALLNNGDFPGPDTPSFWQPKGATNGTCRPGTASLIGGGLVQGQVFTHTLSQISTKTQITGLAASAVGSSLQNVQASQNYLDAPDVGTILNCYGELGTAVSASLNATSMGPALTAPLPDLNPTGALALSGRC